MLMIRKILKDDSGNPDASLLKGLKEGDRIAYTRLLGKYYDMVFLIVSALDDSGDEAQTRSKTADILLSVWADRESILLEHPLKNHLFDFIYKRFKENGGKI